MAFRHVGNDEWELLVRQDPALLKLVDVTTLCGDASTARAKLDWKPTHSFEQTVHEMVKSALGRTSCAE